MDDDKSFKKYYEHYLTERSSIIEKILKYKNELELVNTTDTNTYIDRHIREDMVELQSNIEKFDIEKCREKYTNTKFLDTQLKICSVNIDRIKKQMNDLISLLESPNTEGRAEYLKARISEYNNYIYVQELYIAETDKKIELEKKYFENRKPTYNYLDVNELGQRKLLNNRVNEKFANSTVDSTNLSKASKCIRSMESPLDKYNFLHNCRKFEIDNELPNLETAEALIVLDRYIMINMPTGLNPKEEGYNKGDLVLLEELYKLVEYIIDDPYFTTTEKFTRILSFFIGNVKTYVYSLFYKLLNSPLTRIIEKVEACKFLYYSGDDKYIPDIKKYTLELILDNSIDDRIRFESIACYISNLPLKSKYLDFEVEPISGVDEQLVVDLFNVFIRQNIHPDKLILAYTFLLEQTCDESIKSDVELSLLNIAKSESFPNIEHDKTIRIRADAADVLWRLGTQYNEEAGRLITIIGNMENEIELEKTIYRNSENIHLLNDKMIEYIEKLFMEVKQKFTKIDDVLTDIEIYCNKANLSLNNIGKIRRSLDRILLDCSKFSKYKLTMTTILLTIYNKIYTMKNRTHIISRLLEELIDMSDTCASGHAQRIINTMCGFDEDLVGIMSIDLQLDSNIKTRISNSIKELENGDDIIEASMGENRQIYIDAIYKIYESIKDELYKEFVVAGYMSNEKFNTLTTEIMSKL